MGTNKGYRLLRGQISPHTASAFPGKSLPSANLLKYPTEQIDSFLKHKSSPKELMIFKGSKGSRVQGFE
jgi:hypothetical protein